MNQSPKETEVAHPPVSDRPDRWLGSVARLDCSLSWRKLRGGLLFGLGWLLSPLCWWNDLVFNLPVASGFGALCRLVSADWFLPGMIVGYWLSNIVGILLMQVGAVDVFQSDETRSLKKDLFFGVLSSSIFTAVVLALVHFHILDLPPFLTEASHLSAIAPPVGLQA